MASMARHGVFRNLEKLFEEYGIGHGSCIPVQVLPRAEGPVAGFLDIVGTIAKRDDFHTHILLKSKLRVMAEVL